MPIISFEGKIPRSISICLFWNTSTKLHGILCMYGVAGAACDLMREYQHNNGNTRPLVFCSTS